MNPRKPPKTPIPEGDMPTQYTTRNLWRSLHNRLRLLAARMSVSLEHAFNIALDRGLTSIEKEKDEEK